MFERGDQRWSSETPIRPCCNLPKIPLLKLTSILRVNNRPVIFNASFRAKDSSPVSASSFGNDAVEANDSCMTLSYTLNFVDCAIA